MKVVTSYCIEEELIKKIARDARLKRVSASWFVNEILLNHYLNKGGDENVNKDTQPIV